MTEGEAKEELNDEKSNYGVVRGNVEATLIITRKSQHRVPQRVFSQLLLCDATLCTKIGYKCKCVF